MSCIRTVIIKFTLIFHGTFREGGVEKERERTRERKEWNSMGAHALLQNCGTIYDSSPFVERHEGFPEIALNA